MSFGPTFVALATLATEAINGMMVNPVKQDRMILLSNRAAPRAVARTTGNARFSKLFSAKTMLFSEEGMRVPPVMAVCIAAEREPLQAVGLDVAERQGKGRDRASNSFHRLKGGRTLE